MTSHRKNRRAVLLGATALAGALALATGTPATAQEQRQFQFSQPVQPLSAALRAYGATADQQIIFADADIDGRTAPALNGRYTAEDALNLLLAGTELYVRRTDFGVLQISATPAPQSGSAAGDGADSGTVDTLVVTAQKREEDIQDVPIAISAFTQETLERSQVAGGPDLMTQVPNMTFTKTNFTSYSIQLRGIGTQAISATTDAAVAVAFNNTPFIRNRFFEQEFYDLQRVEVLRGPQGTLYGRNATAGVVNLISQKPKLDAYEAKLSGDIANYSTTRVEGMVNVPLVDDQVALRLAGAWTKREGYTTNEITGNPIDGRDLWSTRVSLRISPNDRLDANLIWEHFEEDDDRLRSAKQLCNTHVVTEVGGIATPDRLQTLAEFGQSGLFSGVQGTFSQGCAPASLYSPDSFEVPNGLSLPYYGALAAQSLPVALTDPYASTVQSHDLRVIESTVDPNYKANTDVVELQVGYDLTDNLTITSETAYSIDEIFSTQDFNRFNTASGAWSTAPDNPGGTNSWVDQGILTPDGEFCDPQIGCSDRLVGIDVSTARSRIFSQELRLASDYEGPFNFSLGANFLRYDTEDKYYVFFNSLTMYAARTGTQSTTGAVFRRMWEPGVTDNGDCLPDGFREPDTNQIQDIVGCVYIDPNPVTSLNDLGHNHFLSRNPYKLISYAAFGEAYYQLAQDLKLTAGFRWTVDKKEAPLIPSWVLSSNNVGYPAAELVEQEWQEPTGRLALDWKPALTFTDETLLYASYAHGYKAGGMNPPPAGIVLRGVRQSTPQGYLQGSAAHPKVFEPEFIDAFELGAKNTLLDGALTMNLAAFYYDYEGYQISQIVNRSAVNMNFDAEIWGLELESDWRPAENLRLGLKLGYENTKVADGERAIDTMDRTAGNPNWVIVRPFPSLPSNCILPTWLFIGDPSSGSVDPTGENPWLVNVGGRGGGNPGGCEYSYVLGLDPATAHAFQLFPYDNPDLEFSGAAFRQDVNYPGWSTNPTDYPCLPAGVAIEVMDYPGVDPACLAALSNNGAGFYKDLSGNELPNAPNFTATITADYTLPLPNDWFATLHTDLYYQSEAWTRIFNTEGYDKLKAYTNVNLAAIFTNDEAGWKVMAYVKNVFDRDSITGAFLNSDDTGLTTNVFLTEPRLYGLRVTKDWSGGPWWTGANPGSPGPFPLTVELGGQVQRHDAPYSTIAAGWVGNLDEGLDPTSVQHRDLDWGDGRSAKLTWRPNGAWTVAAGVRFGRTNSDTPRQHSELDTDEIICGGAPGSMIYEYICNPESPYYNYPGFELWLLNPPGSSADGQARSREEHTIVDFSVGRDVGLGLAHSTVNAGIRHAQLESKTTIFGQSFGSWDIPVGWGSLAEVYDSSYQRMEARISNEREFKGAGPMLSWDAAMALLGGRETGRLNLDWSLAAGVLFGKQETSVSGHELVATYSGSYILRLQNDVPFDLDEEALVVHDERRSRSVTVPVVDLSLGLSYETGRLQVGAGYRWERYFDALDAGFLDAADADRTIDGPYFKLAVGFGG